MADLLARMVDHRRPHHTTVFEYPAPFGDDVEFEYINDIYQSRQPEDLANRYNPLEPIINTELVEHNLEQYKAEKTSFWYINAATETRLTLCNTLSRDRRPARINSLREECDALQKTVGVTRIKAAAVRYITGEDRDGFVHRMAGENWMWVQRDTTHRRTVKDSVTLVSSSQCYKFPLQDLFDRQHSRSLIIHALRHLVNGLSNRAIQHNYELMKRKGLDAGDALSAAQFAWKSHASHQQWLIDKHMPALDPHLVSNSDVCAICKITLPNLDFGQVDWNDILGEAVDVVYDHRHEAVRPPCGHLFGRACLLQTFKTMERPHKFRCPICQMQILTVSQVKSVAFGLDEHGVYNYDKHFTEYENFERSCADLDHYDDQDMEQQILLDRNVLLEGWQVMLEGARLETEDVTPRHLQAAWDPELASAESTFRADLRSIRKGECFPNSVRHFVCKLSLSISRMSIFRYMGPFWQYMTPHEVARVETHAQDGTDMPYDEGDLALILPRRPGLNLFIRMMVTRCVRFQQCRQCSCDNPAIFHKHGERTFYHPIPKRR
nr:hypothetical protein CFP56_28754 [Quercus suber]